MLVTNCKSATIYEVRDLSIKYVTYASCEGYVINSSQTDTNDNYLKRKRTIMRLNQNMY